MHRDRNDQQDQHRRFGQRLVRQPVDHRPERHDDRQRQQDLQRHRPLRQRHGAQQRPERQRIREIPQRHPGVATPLARAHCGHRLDDRDRGTRSQQQPDRSRHPTRLQGDQRQRTVRNELALRNEDYPRDRERQHQREREQRIDRTVGDAVLREEQGDVKVHRAFSLLTACALRHFETASSCAATEPGVARHRRRHWHDAGGCPLGDAAAVRGGSGDVPGACLSERRERVSRPAR